MKKAILFIFFLILIPIFVNVISNLISEYLLNEDSQTLEKVVYENFKPPEMSEAPKIIDDKMTEQPVQVPKIGEKIAKQPVQVAKVDENTFEMPKMANKNPISIDFWLDEKGKMYFQNNQAVVVHYKVEAAGEQSLFFSLFNRASSGGAWSSLLENQLVKVGELYSFPVVKSSQFATQGFELRLQAGTEYFLAVVSAEANGNSELARKELIVKVDG